MTNMTKPFASQAKSYIHSLYQSFNDETLVKIEELAKDLLSAWNEKRQVFICGNGGSAANAIHIANDLIYGIGISEGNNCIPGIRVEALPSNQGVLTCLANDTGYENIFSIQLKVKANVNDILIVLSGSGNSSNICNALHAAKSMGCKSHAIVAFSGGKASQLADNTIYFPVNDMQMAEDTQLIVGHLCMQWLNKNIVNS